MHKDQNLLFQFPNTAKLVWDLAQIVQDPDKSISKTDNKVSKSLPIFGIANVISLILLNKIAKNEYDIKVLSNTQVKIQLKASTKYISIVKALQATNTDFHNYKMKDKRRFKVVLKNIHSSINLE